MGLEVAAFTAISAAIGIGTSAYSAKEQAKTQKKIAANSAAQEEQRKAQVALEMRNKQREAIRSAQMAAARANVNTSSAGAGQSSGASGGQGAITSNLANTIGGLQGAFQISQNIFDLNARQASLQAQNNTWGAIGGFGQQLFQSSGQLGQMFGSAPQGAQSVASNDWGNNVTVFRPMA